MLLPILILQSHINKCLNNPVDLANLKGLSTWVGKLMGAIITQFCYLPIAATTSGTINYLPNWLPLNLSKAYTSNYVYVFASQMQKSQQHFQEMTPAERQELLRQLKTDYSLILIDYFTTDKTLKDKIDKFINTIFYANIPVPQIIEIHMEIIEEFSHQLKLEGRSNETLLDYRLTLIDILAHLCEVYRSSISK
ncbi:KaiA family protein [Nostoc sp. 'Lobaria pulmonaria (5183) cyanobiont']|uniref:KaiA family protein n=1 Tax=Nostoc sp. 'Lobaria pulmonaria (5183) cyanobiont' TaxID=1618022 RepID=UPI000CF32EEE|nr:KaiA family protein [Nostoc sp. 'Lobaria pulmonaria (5183) cyanobiont']AVH73616.1 circadian clock protein KaiA [Nostoc sp. 'Lobaria pulmonaria (5183) cyanobiont']